MKAISSEEFEVRFNDGEDITELLDLSQGQHVSKPSVRRISMDIPSSMVDGLDRWAERLGVNRQAVIKFAIDRALDEEQEKHGKVASE